MTSDVYTYLDTIDETASEFRALGTMLVHSLETGESLTSAAAGIDSLYRRACGDLENAVELVRDTLAHERSKGLSVSDPALIASITGTSLNTVKSVVWAACHINLEPFTDNALADDDALYEVFRTKFRAADLVERARGTVSEWSGQPPEVVEKVLHAANEAATEFMYRTHKDERSPASLKLDQAIRDAQADYRRAKAEQLKSKSVGENNAPDDDSLVARHLAEGPIPDHFKAEALAERLRNGVDPSRIAKAVNLKPETVERVIAQLLAEPEEADKATGTEG